MALTKARLLKHDFPVHRNCRASILTPFGLVGSYCRGRKCRGSVTSVLLEGGELRYLDADKTEFGNFLVSLLVTAIGRSSSATCFSKASSKPDNANKQRLTSPKTPSKVLSNKSRWRMRANLSAGTGCFKQIPSPNPFSSRF